jgi:hypothetical protein
LLIYFIFIFILKPHPDFLSVVSGLGRTVLSQRRRAERLLPVMCDDEPAALLASTRGARAHGPL